jgi:uncharacterized membrane protein YkgB
MNRELHGLIHLALIGVMANILIDELKFVETTEDSMSNFLMNDQFIEFRTLYEHSERYAEDAAENWCLGVIK